MNGPIFSTAKINGPIFSTTKINGLGGKLLDALFEGESIREESDQHVRDLRDVTFERTADANRPES